MIHEGLEKYLGGNLWQRPYPHYGTCWIALGHFEDDREESMILLTDPREQGGMVCVLDDEGGGYVSRFTPSQLEERFTREGWTYLGRLNEILRVEMEENAQ